jgi:hypothetical protein
MKTKALIIVMYLYVGYSMAKNLRAKIPPADTLTICDVNKDVLHKFVEDAASLTAADCMDTLKRDLNIEITTNVREAAERSVSSTSRGIQCVFRFRT